jgi:hypothetical protein
LNICPLCVDEQADPKSPKYIEADRRQKPPIPCPEHGDPRVLYPENYDALEIYQRLRWHHIPHEYEIGGQIIRKQHLDMSLALSLCYAYKVEDIPEMLDKLEAIHSEIFHE